MSKDRRFSGFSIEDNRVPTLFNTVVLDTEPADDKDNKKPCTENPKERVSEYTFS